MRLYWRCLADICCRFNLWQQFLRFRDRLFKLPSSCLVKIASNRTEGASYINGHVQRGLAFFPKTKEKKIGNPVYCPAQDKARYGNPGVFTTGMYIDLDQVRKRHACLIFSAISAVMLHSEHQCVVVTVKRLLDALIVCWPRGCKID